MSELDVRKRAATAYPINEHLAARWSPRAFRQASMDREQIGSLFEAARWSASSFNEQPWRFVYAERETDPEGFERILGTLMDMNQTWARNASLLIIAAANTIGRGRTNRKAVYDTGQAVANLTTQATCMGLHVHQMGGFSGDAARTALNLPGEWEPVVAIAVGYRDEPDTLAGELAEREVSDRERMRLSDFVFAGTADAPADLG